MPNLVALEHRKRGSKIAGFGAGRYASRGGQKRFVDKGEEVLEVHADKMLSKEFRMAGCDWVLSTDRYSVQSEAGARPTEYLAVKLELNIDNGKEFEVKTSCILSIGHNTEKLTSIGSNLRNIPEVHQKFTAILRGNKRSFIAKKFVRVGDVKGKTSPLVDWNGVFKVKLELQVLSVAISQFPALNFGAKSSRDDFKIEVEKKGQKGTVDFYVDEKILRVHSDFFDVMMRNGSFVESEQNCLKLKAGVISPKGFANFVAILHASKVRVSACRVLEILGFADSILCPTVVGHCEQYLISRQSSIIPPSQKLALADKYDLHTLKAYLIGRLATKESVEELLAATRLQGKKKLELSEDTIEILSRRTNIVPKAKGIAARWKEKKQKRKEAKEARNKDKPKKARG